MSHTLLYNPECYSCILKTHLNTEASSQLCPESGRGENKLLTCQALKIAFPVHTHGEREVIEWRDEQFSDVERRAAAPQLCSLRLRSTRGQTGEGGGVSEGESPSNRKQRRC